MSSSASNSNKIACAIIGAVNGQIATVFGKLAKLQAKKPFAFAIIAGDLFAEPDRFTEADEEDLVNLLDNKIEIPLPTYFTLGKRPLPEAIVQRLRANGGEICENLSILGRNVSIKTSEGVRIVAIGGAHTSQDDSDLAEYAPYHSDNDIDRAKSYSDTDILITTDWPEGVRNGSKSSTYYVGGNPPPGDRSIADLCAAIKPRYHFSTSSSFFEREPFFHSGDAPRPITRFISLPPYGNPNREKWLTGLNIEPSAPAPQEVPPGCTACPFPSSSPSRKRKLEPQESAYNGFRFAAGNNTSSHGRDSYRPNGRGGKRQRHDTPRNDPSTCYFCILSDNFAPHMAVSMGADEGALMTTSRGPLTTNASFPDLSMHCHILIVPVLHAPTFYAMGNGAAEALAEMKRYREELHTMISAKSSAGDSGEATLGAVTYEISRATGMHLHWQFIPVPVELVKKGMVEAAFDVEAENLGYGNFVKTEKECKEVEEAGDYFKAMIWTEAGDKTMVLPLKEGMRFDLQFGRSVLGKLLGLEKRRHWKDCEQTVEEEEADAEAFKEMFRDFDHMVAERKDIADGQ